MAGRACTVCSSPSVTAINAGLTEGVPLSVLSGRYGVSTSALSRHQNGHLRPALALAAEATDFTPTSVVERLIEVADDARAARRLAALQGSAIARTRAIETETKTLVAVADRLGVDDLTITGYLVATSELVSALGRFAYEHPASAADLIALLRVRDQEELADDLERITRKGMTA